MTYWISLDLRRIKDIYKKKYAHRIDYNVFLTNI